MEVESIRQKSIKKETGTQRVHVGTHLGTHCSIAKIRVTTGFLGQGTQGTRGFIFPYMKV